MLILGIPKDMECRLWYRSGEDLVLLDGELYALGKTSFVCIFTQYIYM